MVISPATMVSQGTTGQLVSARIDPTHHSGASSIDSDKTQRMARRRVFTAVYGTVLGGILRTTRELPFSRAIVVSLLLEHPVPSIAALDSALTLRAHRHLGCL
jgi:hypothetical protein